MESQPTGNKPGSVGRPVGWLKIIVICTLVTIGGAVAGLVLIRQWSHSGFDRTQNVLPPETRKVLDTAQRFILLSLDPGDKLFRGKRASWAIETNTVP